MDSHLQGKNKLDLLDWFDVTEYAVQYPWMLRLYENILAQDIDVV